ncbi:polysaccharide pyruvyl transferase family protein [Dietzia sp. 179-F 9C3 NHS]|uniref:polysaccharide pyruvyl transferase family protein n=1 Tax=Dietzia sp. 179-F 9C3 NHS TaxID=3374295 RepID=UPI0038793ED5
MASIGVVSIHDLNNVGNRLQSAALSTALAGLGHTPVAIPNTPYRYGPGRDAPGPESIAATARRLAGERDWWGLVDKAGRAAVMRARVRALTRFTGENVRVDPRWVTAPGDGEELVDDYDAFVTGSDQVWNPTYRFGCPTDFLDFAPPGRRVAYAASFGVSELPARYVPHYREMLSGLDHVSVREHSGAALVRDLVGREVPVVLDPTMLVPVAHWSRLADRAPRPSPSPFLATYLLWTGDRATQCAVHSLARSRRLRARQLLAPGLHRPGYYGAENFLRTLRDAEVVVTDSFHSTLFALLFGTPVRVLSRGPGQDDRIESLLGLFHVDPAEAFGSADDPPAAPLVADPEAALAPHRERSLAWLADAIDAAASGRARGNENGT